MSESLLEKKMGNKSASMEKEQVKWEDKQINYINPNQSKNITLVEKTKHGNKTRNLMLANYTLSHLNNPQ